MKMREVRPIGTPFWRTYPDLHEEQSMNTQEAKPTKCDYCDNTENITTFVDRTGEKPDIHIFRDCYAFDQCEEL